MPERETPDHASPHLSDDLFASLPEPSHRPPAVDQTPPAPGSRRARREAGRDAGAPVIPAAEPATPAAEAPLAAQPATVAFPVIAAEPVLPESAAPAAESPAAKPTIDDLFAADSDDDGHGRGRKKKRRTGCIVALVILLVIIGGGVAGGFWVMNTYGDKVNELMGWGEPKDYEAGEATGEATVVIREGDTGSPVSSALYEAGVTKTESVFYDYLVKEGLNPTFYPGVYTLQQKMTAEAAAAALDDPENRMEHTVSTMEGGTVDTALVTISESLGIPLEEITAAADEPSAFGVPSDSLEGWLFPALYTFDPEVTATEVIQRMVDRTRESLTAAGVVAGDEQRVLTIASIIQREGRTDDFAKVSRVIQNRLDDGMMLQMDSTAQYGYGELHAGVVSTSAEAQFDDNLWNTYVHEGLPIGPIANPGDDAIYAALHPADGPWFYFVTINPQSGETVFTVTYEEHQAAIKLWHQWCEENPDQGC